MDMLVNLVELPPAVQPEGVIVRPALSFQRAHVEKFVTETFAASWADEIAPGLSRTPSTVFVATRDGKVIGFAGYNCTALGFFGPEGVTESERGKGVGKSLLLAALWNMRSEGYVYAAIGGVGPVDFYTRTVNAFSIPNSDPGIYGDPITG